MQVVSGFSRCTATAGNGPQLSAGNDVPSFVILPPTTTWLAFQRILVTTPFVALPHTPTTWLTLKILVNLVRGVAFLWRKRPEQQPIAINGRFELQWRTTCARP